MNHFTSARRMSGHTGFAFDIDFISINATFPDGSTGRIPSIVKDRIMTRIRSEILLQMEMIVSQECIHSKKSEPRLWVASDDPTPNLHHTEPN